MSQQVAVEKYLGEKEVVRGECWVVFVPLVLVVLVVGEELAVLVVDEELVVPVVGVERQEVLVVEVLVVRAERRGVLVVGVHGLALSCVSVAPSLHEVLAAPVVVLLAVRVEVVVAVRVEVEAVVVGAVASCFGLAECPD